MTGAGATDTPNVPHRKEIDGPSGGVVHVTEITDAACPWAWGSEPAFRLLRHTLGPHLSWRRVFGILFDEDDDPAPDPDAEARWYERFIDGVTAHTEAPHARRLHWLTRTSWPASLAAKAAEGQGRAVAEHVLRRLRESTFVSGTPADSRDGVRDAVRGVPGLDVDRLLRDMGEEGVCAAVRDDRARARRPHPEVFGLEAPGPHPGRAKELADGWRYALPTLLFDGPGGPVRVPGWRPVRSYFEAAAVAAGRPLPAPSPMPAAQALERWRSLTGPELLLFTGESAPPPGAVLIETGHGPLWLHPDEASGHPAA